MQSLLLRFGGGIGDLNIGEVFLADGAEGVDIYRRCIVSICSFRVYRLCDNKEEGSSGIIPLQPTPSA